jgi:hypothetical protein
MKRAYTATETALVEWVEGKPYSRAVEWDMVILFKGGESGLGKHHMSFRKPLKNTPDARTCIILDCNQLSHLISG